MTPFIGGSPRSPTDCIIDIVTGGCLRSNDQFAYDPLGRFSFMNGFLKGTFLLLLYWVLPRTSVIRGEKILDLGY